MADRLREQLQTMQELNLRQQQTIRSYERLLTTIGDEQCELGVDPDTFRNYYPAYLSPAERNEKDAALRAQAPVSNIARG